MFVFCSQLASVTAVSNCSYSHGFLKVRFEKWIASPYNQYKLLERTYCKLGQVRWIINHCVSGWTKAKVYFIQTLSSQQVLVVKAPVNLRVIRRLLPWAASWPWPLLLCPRRMMVFGVLTLVLSWTSLGAELAAAVVSCFSLLSSDQPFDPVQTGTNWPRHQFLSRLTAMMNCSNCSCTALEKCLSRVFWVAEKRSLCTVSMRCHMCLCVCTCMLNKHLKGVSTRGVVVTIWASH